MGRNGQEPRSFLRRLERSQVGEAGISGLVILILLIAVAGNLPTSEIQRRLTQVLEPAANSLGLDQAWGMFAPEPIHRDDLLEVHVKMDSGADRVWVNGWDDHIVGVFDWYHAQKLKEFVVRQPELRRDYARWLARTLAQPNERPVHVTMDLRWQDIPPPGSKDTPTTLESLYEEDLSGQP